MINDNLYFDYAAATPVDPEVLKAMLPYLKDNFYNPSATYLKAKKVRDELNNARSVVANILGSKSGEVVFTAGATEANNAAIRGVLEHFKGSNVVVSSIEHESVLKPAGLYSVKYAEVDSKGILDLEKLEKLIDDKTVLISVMHANNEIGTIQPISEVSRLVAKIRQQRVKSKNKLPLYVHTDAAQAANYLDLHVSRLGVDLMSINGGKIYGPKQSGVLYINSNVQINPLILGGGQERNFRSGTENVAGSIGLSKALGLVQGKRKSESERLSELQKLFMDKLMQSIPEAVINGDLKRRLPNNIHITLPGMDNERLLLQLESNGILAASGSACSASDEEPSHVLKAIGVSETDARSSLRFSMGRFSNKNSVMIALKLLDELFNN